MSTFSAALLVGGQSTRMGRDKALLSVPGTNLLLWQRQLVVLEDLRPEEIFWSGPTRPGVPEYVHPVEDEIENAGPLAGICACLHQLRGGFLIVLAVDMPRMNVDFLRRLLAACSPGCGAVPVRGGFFEPLAAVYPKEIFPLAKQHLEAGRLALQDLIRQAVNNGELQAVPVEKRDDSLFKNLNQPMDLPDR